MSEPIWNQFLTERDKAVFAASGYGTGIAVDSGCRLQAAKTSRRAPNRQPKKQTDITFCL